MLKSLPFVLAQTDDNAPPVDPTSGESLSLIEGQSGAPLSQPGNSQTPSSFPNFFWILILLMIVWFVFMMGGQRKEKKKRAAMLGALAKGHKVQTAGGVLGTVVEVREQEVVVKVDENTNSRLRFARSAIQSVLEDPSDGKK